MRPRSNLENVSRSLNNAKSVDVWFHLPDSVIIRNVKLRTSIIVYRDDISVRIDKDIRAYRLLYLTIRERSFDVWQLRPHFEMHFKSKICFPPPVLYLKSTKIARKGTSSLSSRQCSFESWNPIQKSDRLEPEWKIRTVQEQTSVSHPINIAWCEYHIDDLMHYIREGRPFSQYISILRYPVLRLFLWYACTEMTMQENNRAWITWNNDLFRKWTIPSIHLSLYVPIFSRSRFRTWYEYDYVYNLPCILIGNIVKDRL